MTIIWGVAVVAVLVAYFVLHSFEIRRLKKVFRESEERFAASIRVAERDLNHSSLMLAVAEGEAERLRAELATAAELRDAAEAQAKADRDHLRMYQEKVIPNVIKERDRWHDIATEDAAGYGAAQNLMMQHLDRMAKIANKPLPKQVVDLQRIIADRAPVTQTERVPESEHQAGVVVKLPPLKGKTWNGTEPPPDGAA